MAGARGGAREARAPPRRRVEMRSQAALRGEPGRHAVPARHWHALADGRIQCDLCPRGCRLAAGQRGLCVVRENRDGALILTAWGRCSGLCVDPIEKKPLAHFLPGSTVLSFGGVGCNLTCRFCQNWHISKARSLDRLSQDASPEAIAESAVRLGCRSVAFTYNEPVIAHEFVVDVALACRERGIHPVAVTSGYVCAPARAELFPLLAAANVDLKAFSDRFYRSMCSARLAPVLETLRYVRHETPAWLEITTLLIPGENDSDDELEGMTSWVVEQLGPDVPMHFSAFHPDFRLRDHPPTPLATLRRARDIALRNGVHHAYTGNVRDPQGSTTFCAGCGESVIVRDGYRIVQRRLSGDSGDRCACCGRALAGVFERGALA